MYVHSYLTYFAVTCAYFIQSQVALNLERNPFMQVTLADACPHGATVQTPGPGAGGGTAEVLAADANEPIIPARNFIACWPLDLSAFLAGESSVDLFVGQICDNGELASVRSDIAFGRSDLSQQKGGKQTNAIDVTNTEIVGDRVDRRRANAPPAPLGIRHLHISVCISNAESAVESTAPVEPQERENDATDGAFQGGSSNKARKLLSSETMDKLNPLSITITTANSLPGVRIEALALQKHVQPSKFSLLEKYCKPVYVVCRPFPEDLRRDALHPRVIMTPLSAQRSHVRIGHTSAFLLGPMDRHRLEEWADNFSLSMEVHDR